MKKDEPDTPPKQGKGRVVQETPPPDAGGPPLRNRPVNLPPRPRARRPGSPVSAKETVGSVVAEAEKRRRQEQERQPQGGRERNPADGRR